ncbi:sulfite exporter TauE/SafE family protein, partial [Clostridium saudiense]|nr:sulfite exporter TauE/SafE family protein [Clostridium saudiense]
CIGMCGGIMISQSITTKESSKFERLKPSLLYNSGRVISYTILGGIVGGLGSVFSLSSSAQGFISIIAGIFMMVMGLNIYGFKALRRFNIKLPWSSCKVSSKKNTPFIVGLLNGFMPCGPLQAMQLYALATGNIVSGALSMFFFALGTIPLMILFGVISSLLTKKGTKNLLKISGVIVLVLGISMTNRGLAILGVDFTSASDNKETTISTNSENVAVINGDEQTIRISAVVSGYSPKT